MYTFSSEKNAKLIKERNISFEEIIAAIDDDNLIDILEHPNQLKYGNQKIYVVWAKNYIYLVPFTMDKKGEIFLKTIIPNRKYRKRYLEKMNET